MRTHQSLLKYYFGGSERVKKKKQKNPKVKNLMHRFAIQKKAF